MASPILPVPDEQPPSGGGPISGGGTTPDPNADPSQGSGIGKVKAEADSTKLRSFLANLPGDDD